MTNAVAPVALGKSSRGGLVESRVQRVLAATKVLSPELYELFDRRFLRGQSDALVCQDLGLSSDQFQARNAELMRTLAKTLPQGAMA